MTPDPVPPAGPQPDRAGAAPDQLTRSAELLQRLLGDPDLRRRFRADPATVLADAGLPELVAGLGEGRQALIALEQRESRSSLAGMLVAAAAEGVELTHLAESAAPALAHDASGALDHLVSQPRHAPAHPLPHPAPAHPLPHPAPAHPLPQLAPATHSADPAARPADSVKPAEAAHPAGPARSADPTVAAHSAEPARHQPAPAHDAHKADARHEPTAPAHAAAADPVLGYPGDQAAPQQLAAWMGARARQAGLPPELPVMAALTESGLRNLSYGDRDSVGFFQMRLGIWDEGPYAGYPDHPDLQVQWFIDHALAVRSENPALAASPDSWGEWVADIEQPAAQYRYRYQLQLGAAQELLRGADLAPTAGSVAPLSVGHAALDEAMRLVGHGGRHAASPPIGPDAAGLVQFAYARQDIQLPQVAAEQFDVGIPVPRHDLRPGDAVFFTQPGGYIRQVGLYIGHDRFVSASAGGHDVTVSSLSDPRFAETYAGARRYTAAAVSDPRSYARPLPTITPG